MSLARRLLDEPLHVLVVGSGGPTSHVLAGVRDDCVVDVVSPPTAVERAGDSRVVCIVIDRDETEDWGQLLDRLTAVSDPPSVVLVGEQPNRSAIDATYTEGGSVLLAFDDESSLQSGVETAVERYLDRHSDALARAALESLFEGTDRTMFVKDRTGTYLKCETPDGGPDPQSVCGQTDVDLRSHGGFGTHWAEHDRRVLESGEPDRSVVDPADSEAQFESTVVPWERATGEVVGVVGSRREISDQRARVERLEHDRERLEQLARYLSHDLKNPLAVADGYLELAQTDGDEAALEHVEDALDRMTELIDDLSVMAQNRSQMATTVPQTDLWTVVNKTWDLLVRDEPAVELDLEMPAGTLVNAPAASLRPLLENLFKNALVHGRVDDQDSLTVTVGTIDGGFYVADDGPGIPESERRQIFDEGYSSADGRTGDGLAIVADIADANDWTVSITDSDSGGARFEITDCLLVPEPDHEYTAVDSLRLTETVDIGAVRIPGEVSADETGSQWTITAEGRDIWHDRNDFTFQCVAVDGPVRIQGVIPSIDASGPFSKAGLMIRDELDPESSHAHIGRNADHVVELLHRSSAGDMTTGNQLTVSEDAKRTVRLERTGKLVTRSLSTPDGEWQPIDQRRIDLDETVYVGLAVCSTVPGETSTATFEDVVVQRLETE